MPANVGTGPTRASCGGAWRPRPTPLRAPTVRRIIMRVAAYVRVSTPGQVKLQTIDQQLETIHRYVQNKGWELPDENVFRDDGFSGASLDRPALGISCATRRGSENWTWSCYSLRTASPATVGPPDGPHRGVGEMRLSGRVRREADELRAQRPAVVADKGSGSGV